MNVTRYSVFAFALALSVWPQAPAEGASRCYPTERFRVLDDGWVRDTLTKLVWQRQASVQVMTWAAANAYCSDAGLRLPTVKELLSIVVLSDLAGLRVDPEAFPNMPAEHFWTSSPFAGESGYAWNVYFYNGNPEVSSVRESNWVRCVR